LVARRRYRHQIRQLPQRQEIRCDGTPAFIGEKYDCIAVARAANEGLSLTPSALSNSGKSAGSGGADGMSSFNSEGLQDRG
jgi:hypothetical protein